MSYKNAVETYYQDILNLLKMLDIYIINYRNLVAALNDINLNPLVSRVRKKKAIKQVNELSCIIDCILLAICEAQKCYLRYVQIKSNVLCEIVTYDFVKLELEQEILKGVSDECRREIFTLCPPKCKVLSNHKEVNLNKVKCSKVKEKHECKES